VAAESLWSTGSCSLPHPKGAAIESKGALDLATWNIHLWDEKWRLFNPIWALLGASLYRVNEARNPTVRGPGNRLRPKRL